jgi:hypothetical protein
VKAVSEAVLRAATIPTLLAVLVALIAPFLAAPERASACTCSGRSIESLAAEPSLTDLFQARVVALKSSPVDEEFAFQVSRRWKGDTGGLVAAHHWRGCSADIEVGKEYVLGLSRSRIPNDPHAGELHVSMCSVAVPVDGAWPAELAFLGEGTPVPTDNGDPRRLFTGNYDIGEGLQRDYLKLALVAAAAFAAAGVSIAVGRRT